MSYGYEKNERDVDLETLVGEHELSGVDGDRIMVKDWCDREEPCEVLRFVLDGKTYEAVEDPSDGYRSDMAYFRTTDTPIKNMFAPVKVIGRYRTKGEYSGTDAVLELIDAANGKLILEVGASNVDDYYPSFVANWIPGDMAVNAITAQEEK
jgi:hypothetical protein